MVHTGLHTDIVMSHFVIWTSLSPLAITMASKQANIRKQPALGTTMDNMHPLRKKQSELKTHFIQHRKRLLSPL
jgi:hypothetical protein